MEDYLEKCVTTKVDLEALKRMVEPENAEVSLSYILKYSTRGDSNIFQLLTQQRKKDHFVASRKTMVGEAGKGGNKARKLAK